MDNWEIKYTDEIKHALAARQIGNEGMARVCARRAAGILIGEFLHRRGYTGVNRSAYDRVSIFLELPGVAENTREISRHFIMQVDHAHQLPVNADLIQDAIWLKDNLLKGD